MYFMIFNDTKVWKGCIVIIYYQCEQSIKVFQTVIPSYFLYDSVGFLEYIRGDHVRIASTWLAWFNEQNLKVIIRVILVWFICHDWQ